MISIYNLSVQFGGEFLFDDVTFIVGDKDRIGLVGKNGAGKSTLLKILKGLQEPESGDIVLSSDTTVGYLPQDIVVKSNKTVFDEALTAFDEALILESNIKHYTSEISKRTDYNSDSYTKLLNKLNEDSERFLLIGGNTMNAETEKVLLGLGFTANDFIRPIKEFSGGWQMRVELAKLLLQRPSVLLLDEPTNHLDIESIQWLEEYLQYYYGAVVLVSHDKVFLDKVTNRTVEISMCKITDYKASYSEYVKMRAERREHEIASYNNQQKQIAETERFIERFRYKSTKASQVQSRIKLLDKLDKIEVEDIDTSSIHFKFPQAQPSGKVVIESHNITKKYGEKLVLDNIDFTVLRNDRIAFVGKNGEGKTTLTKIITEQIDYVGKFEKGYNVFLGYYAQNQGDLLNPEKTVFETLDEIAVGDIRPKVRSILGGFLFSGDSIDKKVKVLSGGEKSRLAIARLLLSPVNFLILDEPTNHLDMHSKDILKNALLQFNGTLIVVSHDRDFLQGLTNKVFEFKNHKIKEYLGDINYFLQSKKIDSLKEIEKNTKANTSKDNQQESDNKNNWLKKKESEKELRKIEVQITKCEAEIEKIESELQDFDNLFADSEKINNHSNSTDLYNQYNNLKEMLENQMLEWEDLHKKYNEALAISKV